MNEIFILSWLVCGLIGTVGCNYYDWENGHSFTLGGLFISILFVFGGYITFIFGVFPFLKLVFIAPFSYFDKVVLFKGKGK